MNFRMCSGMGGALVSLFLFGAPLNAQESPSDNPFHFELGILQLPPQKTFVFNPGPQFPGKNPFVFKIDPQSPGLTVNTNSPTRTTNSTSCSNPVSELGFDNVLCDQKVIWGTVLHPKRHWRIMVPFAAATLALIATDQYIARAAYSDPPGKPYDVWKHVSDLGIAEVTYGVMGSMYLAGHIARDKKLRQTGLLIAESYADSEIVKQILKYATRRERPADAEGNLLNNGQGRFWRGGISFPAGHAMNTWSLATVLATQYRDKPIVKYTAYGVAVAVSAARIGARAHFPSDVLVGSAMGYFIAKFVVRAHGMP